MQDENSRNLLYFEAHSMRELYDSMENWQVENRKRLLSVSIQRDDGQFCCIALTNPMTVTISDASGGRYAEVFGGELQVYVSNMP